MKEQPELSPSQVTTHASVLWNKFTSDEKEPYKKLYEQNKQEYDELKQRILQKKSRLDGENNIVRISDSEDCDDEFEL